MDSLKLEPVYRMLSIGCGTGLREGVRGPWG